MNDHTIPHAPRPSSTVTNLVSLTASQLILSSTALAGPVILSSTSYTHNGEKGAAPLPSSGLVVLDNVADDDPASAIVLQLGDNLVGTIGTSSGPTSGVSLDELEPNQQTATATPIQLGDEVFGHIGMSRLPHTGQILPEVEPNDSSESALALELGDTWTGTVTGGRVLPFTRVDVQEVEPNEALEQALHVGLGTDILGRVAATIAPSTGPTEEVEPNNDLGTATPYMPNSDLEGQLTAEDVDVFRVLANAGQAYKIEWQEGSTGCAGVEIRDGEDTVVESITMGPRYDPRRIIFPTTGEYSLEVSESCGAGSYKLGLQQLIHDDQSDRFHFELAETTTVSILVNDGPNRHALQLLDAAGERFEFERLSTYDEATIIEELPPGDYYIEIDREGFEAYDYHIELREIERDPVDYATFSVESTTGIEIRPSAQSPFSGSIAILSDNGSLSTGLSSYQSSFFFEATPGDYEVRVTAPSGDLGDVDYSVHINAAETDPRDLYAFTVDQAQEVAVTGRMLGIEADFAEVRVLDSDGVGVLASGFMNSDTARATQATLPSAGTFFVEVRATSPSFQSSASEYTLSVGEVDARDAVDYARFDITDTTQVALDSTLRFGRVELSDSGGRLLGRLDDVDGGLFELDAGSYFIRVSDEAATTPLPYEIRLRELDPSSETAYRGWHFAQQALSAVYTHVTRTGNDGSVAVVGAYASDRSSSDAGACYGFAASQLGTVASYHNGARGIAEFFTALTAGEVNPAVIVLPGTEGGNSMTNLEAEAVRQHASILAEFVNSGGGLIAHSSADTGEAWLKALGVDLELRSETRTIYPEVSLTPEGEMMMPALDPIMGMNVDYADGYFAGALPGLSALAKIEGYMGPDGEPLHVVVGGTDVRFPSACGPFADWSQGTTYVGGELVTHAGVHYTCIQSHTAWSSEWTPDQLPALWTVHTPCITAGDPWVQGASYGVDDLVEHEGVQYRCTIAHTALPGWYPHVTPALWQQL